MDPLEPNDQNTKLNSLENSKVFDNYIYSTSQNPKAKSELCIVQGPKFESDLLIIQRLKSEGTF